MAFERLLLDDSGDVLLLDDSGDVLLLEDEILAEGPIKWPVGQVYTPSFSEGQTTPK